IMLTRHGVKVLDFGIAKDIDEASMTTFISGTPAYMAPEQLQGIRSDARADLFALGLVLYEMTVGRLPVPGASLARLMISGSKPNTAVPVELRAKVPVALQNVITILLQRDPEKRTLSATDVAHRLRDPASAKRPRYLSGLSVAAAGFVILIMAGGAWR